MKRILGTVAALVLIAAAFLLSQAPQPSPFTGGTGGGGGSGCVSPGTTSGALLTDNGAGGCTDLTGTSAFVMVAQGASSAPLFKAVSGDGTITAAGALTITKSNGTAFSSLATFPAGTSAGEIIYWNGTAWTGLAGNASGTLFLSESASGAPSWAAASGGSGCSTSGASILYGNGSGGCSNVTFTTTGTGAATFSGGALNIPQNGSKVCAMGNVTGNITVDGQSCASVFGNYTTYTMTLTGNTTVSTIQNVPADGMDLVVTQNASTIYTFTAAGIQNAPQASQTTGAYINFHISSDSSTYRYLAGSTSQGYGQGPLGITIPQCPTGPAGAKYFSTFDPTTLVPTWESSACSSVATDGTTIAAVISAAAVSHEWVNRIDHGGVQHLSQPAFTDITGAITSAQLTTQYKTWTCAGPGLGDGLNAMAAATYLQANCYNGTGVTVTLTGILCRTDNGGSSTLNAADSSANALLTGAVTCTASYAADSELTHYLSFRRLYQFHLRCGRYE